VIDPGRYFAEAIYFLQYALAQILWAINRAAISIAVIAESINRWLTANVGYLVELLVNGLAAPLGGMFILALTALGLWYTLNTVVPTSRWVDPSKLLLYSLLAFSFFSAPVLYIELLEEVRTAINAGIDPALLDGAEGSIFDSGMDGTDAGLPTAIPDVNSDGVIGSFDLAAAFMLVANFDELDSSEFPVDFEATYFPFGDPSSIDLSDEADQELAKALANDGIERLFFSFVAIPTAVAEHFLRLALTSVAMFLYTGAPIAMVFAFFLYTQAYLAAYIRQFVNLLIETLMSVIIVAIMLTLLIAAAQQGIGLYIGASFLVLIVLLWRIKSALKLATAAIDLFGGKMITGGAGGNELLQTGRQVVGGAVAAAGAAVTGGAAMALGAGAMTGAALLRSEQANDGLYTSLDASKADGRVRQMEAIAGYAAGKSETMRRVIEGAHETRTLVRNLRDGEVQHHEPDTLDYLRAGSAMSGFGSSPWLAMRTSPSLRAAFDQIGGRRGEYRDAAFDGDGEPVVIPGEIVRGAPSDGRMAGQTERNEAWRQEPATTRQREYLTFLKIPFPEDGSRGQAHDLINQARHPSGHRPPGRTGRREAATDPSGAAGPGGANGPIPDWLMDNPPDGPPNTSYSTASFTSGADPEAATHRASKPTAVGPHIRLEPQTATRQQMMQQIVAQLAQPDTPAGQAARQTLVTYTGSQNANRLQAAAAAHSPAAVQAAVTATVDLVAHYRTQGLADPAVLAAFQGGAATATLRESLATPLNDEQLAAVADMVLLPQRHLTRRELAQTIGQVAAEAPSDEAASAAAVAEAVGAPVPFGGLTGSVRGVLAGARTMALTPEELARLAAMIEEGLRQAVLAELADRGYRPDVVRDFVTDLAALPAALVLPQTTAMARSSVNTGGTETAAGPDNPVTGGPA